MALTTPKLGLPYSELTDSADEPHDIRVLAQKLDTAVPGYGQGTLAARPAAGIAGRLYFATDRATMYYDAGSGADWQPVSSMIGDLKFSVRAAEHQGWIISDGRALSAGQYPQLRAILIADGSLFGNTTGNPKLPDMRGRTAVGAGSNPAEGIAGDYTIGLKFGQEQTAITSAQMPYHSHGGATGGADRDHTHAYLYRYEGGMKVAGGTVNSHYHYDQYIGSGGQSQSHLHAIAAEGGNQAHENRMPMQVSNWFVYAGPAT